MFIRPEKRLIRIVDGNLEEDLDLALSLENETPGHPIGRVEYDMDEQDDRWLEAYNAQRKEEQVEAIKPAIFEITMTQIEKEWHALEKRELWFTRCDVFVLTRLRPRDSQAKSETSPDPSTTFELGGCG